METFFVNIDWSEIARATRDTLLMLGGSMALTVRVRHSAGRAAVPVGQGAAGGQSGAERRCCRWWSMCCGRCPSSSC